MVDATAICKRGPRDDSSAWGVENALKDKSLRCRWQTRATQRLERMLNIPYRIW